MAIKTTYGKLFVITDQGIVLNSSLQSLLNANFKSGLLKYWSQVKLRKELERILKEYDEQRRMILESNSRLKHVKFKNGQEADVYEKLMEPTDDAKEDLLVVEVDGKILDSPLMVSNVYDIVDGNRLTNDIFELLGSEVELYIDKAKLSKFEAEDCSGIDFTMLEDFIEENA